MRDPPRRPAPAVRHEGQMRQALMERERAARISSLSKRTANRSAREGQPLKSLKENCTRRHPFAMTECCSVAADLFVDSSGMRLAVRDFGGSGTPLVLIHGHVGNLAEFDQLGPLFAGHFRTVAYDQRGQGWSDRGPVGIDEWVSDLDVVVKSLHLDRPIVFASSFGTLVGLAYAFAGRDLRAFISQDGRASDFGEPPAAGRAPTP